MPQFRIPVTGKEVCTTTRTYTVEADSLQEAKGMAQEFDPNGRGSFVHPDLSDDVTDAEETGCSPESFTPQDVQHDSITEVE